MSPAELLALPATGLAAQIRAGRVRCVQAMEAVLQRAAEVQPRLNGFIRIEAARALEAARAADREAAAGRWRGPLHGVPMAHKDMYYRSGEVSTCGSKVLRERPAPCTAAALQRLDAAGAIQFATLNMSEFAFNPTGHNWHFGHCRNAWQPDYITGGSSSGSGTSVAARATYAALGSDTGGSIRLPASFCGTVGMMATHGRVSRAGAMPLSHSLDRVGPLTRTVEDAAQLLAVLAGADADDPTCEARAVPDYLAALRRPVKGLRVGRPTRYFYDDIDAGVAACMDASLEVLRSLGATVVDVEPPGLSAAAAAWSIVAASEAAALHTAWLRSRRHDYSEQIRTRLAQGLAIPAHAYVDALRMRGPALRTFCEAVFSKCDVLHAPVVGFSTPTIAESEVGGSPEMMAVLGRITRLTRPISFLGLPALAVPAGFLPNGLPTAMQLVGRPFDEATLFALGHAYQGTTDWHLRAPAH
ncbi:MAG: amidase [Burkholderiales bacterium]|nr:amidase [Burkholderiales bacterium]